jgi:hypothetical protein
VSAVHSCGVQHIKVGVEGRCTECSFHVATQGHRDCCSGTAPIEPASPHTGNFIENMRRRKAAAREIPDELWKTSRPLPAHIAQPGANPAYVVAAIRGELGHLAEAIQGTRNDTLNRVAFAVFGFVKGGHADEQAARAELERIASVIGLSHNEIQATVGSAWTSAVPRDVPAPRGAG